jgi:nucleoside phosphorylase
VIRTANNAPPKHLLGHIACGDSVGDSTEFVAFLTDQCDRKYVALEMESSGVAEAASARGTPIPLLILRGISDRCAQKNTLDRTSEGRWRVAAVANAASLLHHLLRWPDFLLLMKSKLENRSEHDSHSRRVRDFIDGKK